MATTAQPESFPLLRQIARDWWTLLLRGVLAILFGVLAMIQPGVAALSLVLLFGAFALVDGAFAILGAFRFKHWWGLAHGVIAILAGIIAFVQPAVAGIGLVKFIGLFAVVTGVLEILAAWKMRKEIQGEGWIMLGGLASIVFGAIVFASPVIGGLSLMFVVAAFAIANGIALILAGFRFKKLPEKLDALAARAQADRAARGVKG